MLSGLFSAPEVPGALYRAAVALLFTGIAAYYDAFNKKWVPDWVGYGFIAVAILLNIIFFSADLLLPTAAIGIIVFALTYLIYRMGQLGGADVFVMTGIALCLPFFSTPLLGSASSAPYPFILSVLIPTGFFFIAHMLIRFLPYISKRIANGEVKFTFAKIIGPLLICVSLAIFYMVLSTLPIALPSYYLWFLLFLSVSLIFFSLFKDDIKDSMVESVPIGRLQVEDVLALEKMQPALVKKLSLSPLITKKIIAALKKAKIKSVPVYTGMPFFLPYLFLGLLVCILFGDLLFYII